jgi:hypothetical protein
MWLLCPAFHPPHSGYLIAADGTTGPKIHIIALAPQAPQRGDVAAQKELFRSLKRFTVFVW